MRKIRIIEHISLDGVIQGPGGPKEDDYRYGGWAAPHGDPEGVRPSPRLTATISICCWAAEPTTSGAAFGRPPRKAQWRTR